MPTNGTLGGHGLKKRVTLLVVTCKAINGLLPLRRRVRSGARGQEALQSKEDKIGNFFRRARLAYLSYLSAKIAVSTQKLPASPGTKMSLASAKKRCERLAVTTTREDQERILCKLDVDVDG